MSITAMMLHGENNPTLVRDTLFAVVMIILNGMVGAGAAGGRLRHREQHYNLQGANAYLGVIIPLSRAGLMLARLHRDDAGPDAVDRAELFRRDRRAGFYAAFLALQTGRHRGYFTLRGRRPRAGAARTGRPLASCHALLLVAYMLPVVFLAEQLAPADRLRHRDAAVRRRALGGVVIAILVATPEAIGAMRAALGEPPAALDQHLARLGAVDDRPHRAGDAGDQPCHRPRDLFRR